MILLEQTAAGFVAILYYQLRYKLQAKLLQIYANKKRLVLKIQVASVSHEFCRLFSTFLKWKAHLSDYLAFSNIKPKAHFNIYFHVLFGCLIIGQKTGFQGQTNEVENRNTESVLPEFLAIYIKNETSFRSVEGSFGDFERLSTNIEIFLKL